MRPALAALTLSALALAGCPPPAPKPVDSELAPKDEWDSTPQTPEWLHATAGFRGDRKAECGEVLKWVQGEASCKASLCSHGRDLAKDWLMRCPKLTPDSQGDVKTLSEKLTTSAEEAPTACGKDFEAVLSGSCGKDATCVEPAQVWSTRCGKAEGTPLVLRMLERTVERRLTDGAEFELDPRSCDEIRAFMIEGLSCAQQFACQDMMKRVEMYRKRCEGEEKPTVGTAIAQLSITAGAQMPSAPIAVQPTPARVTATDIPLPLVDGSGAVLMVCNDRPADLAKYVAARRECQGGALTIGKVVRIGRDLEVRMASVEFPNDATFLARFPSLVVAGEREVRRKEELAALEADLTKAVSLGQSGSTLEAAFEVFKTTLAHVSSIRTAPEFRAAFTSRDDALAPAMRELGKAKAAFSSRGRMSTNDFVIFVNRASTRAFGDFSPAFSVQPGVTTPAVTLDTQTYMPKSTAAYLEGLQSVIREASRKKLDAQLLHNMTVRGYDLAKACGAAEQAHRDAEAALIKCVFALESCDAPRIESLTKASDDARAATESAFNEIHMLISGPAMSARGEVEQAMLARECHAPVW